MFKRETSFEKRSELCKRIREKYTDRIPIIVEVDPNSKIVLQRKKFLVPHVITMGGFLREIRNQTSIQSNEAIFLFCGNGVLVPTGSGISEVYEKYKDRDGFLYITVATENTFGVWSALNNVVDGVFNSSGRIARTIGIDKWI